MSRDVSFIVVHKSQRPTIETARDMDRAHRAQGYLKIGYHYFVRRDGTVERGRDLREPGAFSREHNPAAVGICLATAEGGDCVPPVTDDQRVALDSLLEQLGAVFPDAKVIGKDTL